MNFLNFTILALAVVASRAEKVQEKRGAVGGYTASTAAPVYEQTGSAVSPAYAKVAQTLAAQKTLAYPEPQQQQYIAAQPAVKYAAAPALYSAAPAPLPQYQQQYVPQSQAVAYAQPAVARAVPAAVQKLAYAAQPAPIQYSQAGDVSTFAYSSPFVTYNNLGVLSQVAGKIAAPAQAYAAAPQPAYAAAPQAAAPEQLSYAPAPVAKAAYSPAPVAYQAAAPQRYVSYAPAPAPQQQYAAQPAAYAAAPQTYQQAQSAPQASYVSSPQYYNAPQQKYATPGVSYAQ